MAEHVCPICLKSFIKLDHLARHVRSHTNERPFRCTKCGKSFTRNDTLLRHERSHAKSTIRGRSALHRPATRSSASTPSDTLIEQGGVFDAPQMAQARISPALEAPDHSSIQHNYVYDTQSTQTFPTLSAVFPLIPRSQHEFEISDDSLSGFGHDSFSTAWQLADDFDINALDIALSTTMTDWAQLHFDGHSSTAPPPFFPLPLSTVAPIGMASADHNTSDNDVTHSRDMMSRQWFTRLAPESSRLQSRAVSEEPIEQAQVTERYRDRLSRTMTPKSFDAAIPSVEYLSLYLKLYSLRLHPLFPVVHLATFRPDTQHSLLFLSMCSLGSLFVRGSGAALQGRSIFERLNKVILASWETHLAHSESAALIMTQAALLGQTFGMLSGRPRDLATVDTFHGTLLAWARRLNISDERTDQTSFHAISSEDKGSQWKEWVSSEQKIRLCLALLIHDAELASLLHHEPTLRWSTFQRIPRLANDALFNANTALKWHATLVSQTPSRFSPFPALRSWINGDDTNPLIVEKLIQDSEFNAYSILQSIHAAILEFRYSRTLDAFRTKHFQDRLLMWYGMYAKQVKKTKSRDQYQLRILWHCTFVVLYADLDVLEIAIGRDGSEQASRYIATVRKWASTVASVRCLYHCLLLRDQADGMRLGSEAALHIPRAVFSAGLVILCYSSAVFQSPPRRQWTAADTIFPETKCMDENTSAVLAEARSFTSGPSSSMECLGLAHKFIDLLQKFDRWGLSQSLARILISALEGVSEQ